MKVDQYKLVIVTEEELNDQVPLNLYCRSKGIRFVSADVNGVFARLFNDFGENFEVLDKNGEECNELFIKSISNEEKAVV
jgi:molybdopterin/thiamine biosynthesis adenylyltransferase